MNPKRPGTPLEQPTTQCSKSVQLTDSDFESSDSDSSKSGDESDSGSVWNSDVEVPPEHENAGVRDRDLNVGQAIQATCITVTHRDGTETQREGTGVVDSFDGLFAKIRFFDPDVYGTIEQGGYGNDYLWPCTNITNPTEKPWVKFLVNVTALLKLPENRVKCDDTLTLVEAILGFMKTPESMRYCSDRSAYFEANDNEEMYDAWDENADKLDKAEGLIEILEDYVARYSTFDAAELSDLLDNLAEEGFPTAVSEAE